VFERMFEALPRQLESKPGPGAFSVEVPPGEVIDKATILDLKLQRSSDPPTLAHLTKELNAFPALRDRILSASPESAALACELKDVNRFLWDAADEIRRCEQVKSFGPRFIDLPRSIYQQNDRRAVIKRTINRLLGSAISEETIYSGK